MSREYFCQFVNLLMAVFECGLLHCPLFYAWLVLQRIPYASLCFVLGVFIAKNPVRSLIGRHLGFLRRAAPGTSGRAQKSREGGGGGGEKRKTACWKTRASSGQNLNPVHQQTGFLIGQETIARL